MLEQDRLNGVQALAAAEPRSVSVDAGELRPLIAAAWCLNRDLAAPHGEPVRPTPLRLSRLPASQEDAWEDRDRYTGT